MDAAHVMYEEYGHRKRKSGAPGRGDSAAALRRRGRAPCRRPVRAAGRLRHADVPRRRPDANAAQRRPRPRLRLRRDRGATKRQREQHHLQRRPRLPRPRGHARSRRLPALRRRRQRGHLRRPPAPPVEESRQGVRRRNQGGAGARRERRHPVLRPGALAGRALLPAPDVGRRRDRRQLPHLPRQPAGDKHHRSVRAAPARRSTRSLLAGLDRGEDPFEFPGVEFTPSTEDSRAINRWPSGSIIIAGSGMANGGRVLHHLRHNLWRAGLLGHLRRLPGHRHAGPGNRRRRASRSRSSARRWRCGPASTQSAG